MSIQIGICDDRSEEIRILSEALYTYDPSFKISTYTSGRSLLDDLDESAIVFDLLFLDIYMPGINGIETAAKIRGKMKDVMIIFVSSSNEHYPEAYDVFAFNYIMKPVNREKLNAVLDQALMSITKERREQFSFTYKSVTSRVYCRDILYLESSDKIVLFHMQNKTTLKCYGKLDELLKKLPEGFFIRCHQSFAVNLFHISEMGDSHFRVDSVSISISKKYLKNAKDQYFDHLFQHMSRGTK
ncbi:MAG: response regulator transcription factor [Eubacteriales bacterium]|nr:response regulator transcription factor [Eubacteriales bacterium]